MSAAACHARPAGTTHYRARVQAADDTAFAGSASHVVASAVPSWIDPQLATLTRERFSGPEWIFERKLDGERCLALAD